MRWARCDIGFYLDPLRSWTEVQFILKIEIVCRANKSSYL